MKMRGFAAVAIVSATLVGAPAMSTPAEAQTAGDALAAAVPVALWAVTGAVIGAVAWPMMVGGGAMAAAATPGVMSAASFLNAGAAIGTVVGGVGYWAITHH
jgi:hypothetical protein